MTGDDEMLRQESFIDVIAAVVTEPSASGPISIIGPVSHQ